MIIQMINKYGIKFSCGELEVERYLEDGCKEVKVEKPKTEKPEVEKPSPEKVV